MLASLKALRQILSCVLFLALSACSGEFGQSARSELHLGKYHWHLPEGWRVASDAGAWQQDQADQAARSVLLRIEGEALQRLVPEYQRRDRPEASRPPTNADDLVLELSLLSAQEAARYRDPERFAELGMLWRAEGSYRGRRVETDFVSGGFKVFRNNEYPHSWTLLRVNPDAADAQMPADATQFWLAQCLGLAATGQATCSTHAIQGDLLLSFDLTEVNLGLIDQVSAALWQQLMMVQEREKKSAG